MIYLDSGCLCMEECLMKRDVIIESKELLNSLIDGKLTLETLVRKCTDHVNGMISQNRKIYFCGKLPWISSIISEIREVHSDKAVDFMDLFVEEDAVQVSCLTKLEDDALYIICSRWHFEEYLNAIGEGKNVMFYPEYLLFLEQRIDNSLFSDKYNYSPHMVRETMKNVITNAESYSELLETLADEKSKRLLASIILFRTGFDLSLTRNIKTEYTHYWDEKIYQFDENDVIVDGGGYTGDSLQTFLDGDFQCKEYWLFEPTDAIVKAKETAEKADFKVHLCKKGLSDKNGILKFSMKLGANGELEGVSQIDEDGESEIEVVRMDEALNSAPTFIKLDIEGSEISALEGGIEKFNENTNFVICAYHKLNDIIDIYNWLKKHGTYQYYMRAERNNLMVDFVIFAIGMLKTQDRSF